MGPAEVELLLTAVAAMLSPTTLTFSVLALVLGDQPRRTGLWFFLGAFGATLLVGIVAAFVIGDVAAAPEGSSQPKTWVCIVDLVFGAIALFYAVRLARTPLSKEREQGMIDQVSKLASSPWVAVVGAGAVLANPGGFIPIALKDISQLNPSSSEYIVLWLAFAVISLLPLAVALVMLTFARDGTLRVLHRVREWLTRNATRIGAVIVLLLGVALIRNGIVGLTG
jgi:hypothetical protein